MHSFNSVLIHCVWSTKKREPALEVDLRDRLWPYLGGVARENKMKALAIGGAADHVHILISLPPTLSVAKAVQAVLRNGSMKRLRECVRSNGKKVTARSASAFPELMRPCRTFGIKQSIIERAHFAKNS